MDVVVAGGSGFIGASLCKGLVKAGHDVVVLSRRSSSVEKALPDNVRIEQWDADSGGPWEAAVASADVVVNLAGENIGGGRWTSRRKERILTSRLEATKALVRALEKKGQAAGRPLLINASGKDYYGDSGDRKVDEKSRAGSGFLADVCRKWEAAALKARELGVTVAVLRLGMVLGPGGSLAKMSLPFRFYLGGSLGSGRQWISWIHRTDVVRLIRHILESHQRREESVEGPWNAVSPSPVTMREFATAIGEAMGRPAKFNVPAPLIKLGLGEMSDLVLTGQRVVPSRALDSGFDYVYSNLDSALAAALQH